MITSRRKEQSNLLAHPTRDIKFEPCNWSEITLLGPFTLIFGSLILVLPLGSTSQ
jgi:hypothetical protein